MTNNSSLPWIKHYPEEVRPNLVYPDKTLVEFLWDSAAKYPELQAIIFQEQEITFTQLADQVKRLATALNKLGVKRGDRVAIMMPNCPQGIIGYYAVLTLGAIVVQTNPMYVERELEYQLNDSGAETIMILDLLYPRARVVKENTPLKNIITVSVPALGTYEGEADPDVHLFEDLVKDIDIDLPVVQMEQEDVAILQYTGGTTGVSKGVMLTHRNLVANVTQLREFNVGFKDGQERILTVLPLFHVYAMTCAMNLAICYGATMVLLPRYEPVQVLTAIERYRPTMFPGAPTMYVGLLNHPDLQKYDLKSIWSCVSGSAPLPMEVQEKFEAVTGAKLVEGYGLSESSPVTHCNPLKGLRKTGAIGIAFPDTVCRIVDVDTGEDLPPGRVGELVIKGPQVMKGYWNKPEETAGTLRDGWLFTGDLAVMDEDGFFFIVDRKKDMIIAGGFNIYPREIEEILYQHPKVQEAIVVGIPDPYRGETVKAYIVVKNDEQLSEEEILQFCDSRLARYKVPRLIEFRRGLPKSAVGKILRRLLRDEELKTPS